MNTKAFFCLITIGAILAGQCQPIKADLTVNTAADILAGMTQVNATITINGYTNGSNTSVTIVGTLLNDLLNFLEVGVYLAFNISGLMLNGQVNISGTPTSIRLVDEYDALKGINNASIAITLVGFVDNSIRTSVNLAGVNASVSFDTSVAGSRANNVVNVRVQNALMVTGMATIKLNAAANAAITINADLLNSLSNVVSIQGKVTQQ